MRANLMRAIGLAVLIVGGAAAVVPSVLSEFSLQLMALFLPFTILALSIDLLWGENRLISFGQGAFFALGGYLAGLVLLGHGSSVSGGGVSLLKDTTTTSTLDSALAALGGVQPAGLPVLGLLLPVAVAGFAGLLIGLVVFRSPAPEVYLPLITLGIGVVAGIWFNGSAVLGGSNGLSGIPSFTGEIADAGSNVAIYRFNLLFVLLAYGGYAWFRRSARGLTWRALGDDPVRLEALGYPVKRMRAYGFGASCGLAGLAGALYAGTAGFMGPSLADVSFSAQPLIWVAVGGVGTLAGPLVGTLLLKWAEQWLSSGLGLDGSWQLLLGLLLIVVVVFAPRGLMGLRGSGNGLLSRVPRLPGRGPARPRAPEPAADSPADHTTSTAAPQLRALLSNTTKTKEPS
ncbi:MAG: branched-chain amino acid ABC transporter permease [Patulibacter sp.]